jgi:hypothetical protein
MGKGWRAENRELRAEDSRTEDRGQKKEDRRKRTVNSEG